MTLKVVSIVDEIIVFDLAFLLILPISLLWYLLPTVVIVVFFSNTFRVKGQTAIFEEMIEDEEGLVDDRITTTNRGLWAISETERSMKALLSFAKSHRFDVEFIDEGSNSMDLFEAWKKEYKVTVIYVFLPVLKILHLYINFNCYFPFSLSIFKNLLQKVEVYTCSPS